MYRELIAGLALVAVANGAVHPITVGQGGSLKFSPDSLTADVGDQLEFHFYSGSGTHSVVSSTFQSPCVPNANAFFSGYITGDDSGTPTFVVNVTSTDPIWFYCSFNSHCPAGMSGVVNPPAGDTIAAYQVAAQSAKVSAPAATATAGGFLTTIASGASGSTTTGGSTSTSTSTGNGTSSATTATTTASTSASKTSSATTSATSASGGSGAYGSGGGNTGAALTRDLSVALGLAVVMGGVAAFMA